MSQDLKNDVSSLLKKLDLSSKKVKEIGERYKKKGHFFTAIIETRQGKKLFLKAKVPTTKEVVNDFRKEVLLYKIFKERFTKKKRGVFFPEIVSSGKHKNLLWYLKKYQEGTLGGLMGKDFGFKNEFLEKSSPKNVERIIRNYQSIPAELITRKVKLYHQGSWWYRQDFNFYKETFLKGFLGSSFNKGIFHKSDLELIQKILNDNKNLLDREANFLCHSDLYPNNTLLTPSKKTVFLDWERATLNNQSIDVAFIYLNAWRSKDWQKRFLKSYLENTEDKDRFKKLFQISLISLSIRFSGHCWRYLENKYFKKQTFKKQTIEKGIKKRASSVLKTHLEVLRTSIYKLNKIL